MPKRCAYIKVGGTRCGAIALTGKNFCFWHSKLNRHHAEADPINSPKFYCKENELRYRQREKLHDDYYSRKRVNGPTADELPPLEDPESIQLALSMVLSSLADFRIDTKRAQLMLYNLQLAMMNERRIKPAVGNSVQEIVVNEFGVEMAPPQIAEPPAEVVIMAPSAAEEEGSASAPAQLHDVSIDSPGFVIGSSHIGPSHVNSAPAGSGFIMSPAETP